MSLQPSYDAAKELLHQQIERHKEAYKQAGGKVTVLPPQEFTYRMCTVSGNGGNAGSLLLYVDKFDAITGGRHRKAVKKFNVGGFEGE